MFELAARGRDLPPWVWRTANAMVAAGLLALCVIVPWIDEGRRPPTPYVMLAAIASAAAAAGFWWPRAGLVIAAATCMFALELDYPDQPLAATILYALFHVGRRRPTTEALAITVGTAVATTAGAVATREITGIDARFWAWLGWCLLAGAAGSIAQGHHAHIVAALDRKARERRAREHEARARVTEERLRIARELHDVVGHTITVINVQAGVAEHVLDSNPPAARTALARIHEASATALDEIRTTLGLLRADEPVMPAVDIAKRRTDNIVDLVGEARGDGLPVELAVEGTPREFPAVTRQTAYRIVQECLTNVVKHGNAVSRVDVKITYGPSQVRLEVTNDGTPVALPLGAGHGIVGMRERLAAVGGSLTAVPLMGGGFRVTAILPTEAPVP